MKSAIKVVDGKVIATKPFIVECGCPSAVVAVNNALKKANIPNNHFSRVKLSGNKMVKQYLEDEGYGQLSKKKGSYAYLIDVRNHDIIDFLSKDKEKLRKDVTDVFQSS